MFSEIFHLHGFFRFFKKFPSFLWFTFSKISTNTSQVAQDIPNSYSHESSPHFTVGSNDDSYPQRGSFDSTDPSICITIFG
jgi:hypothetical protein